MLDPPFYMHYMLLSLTQKKCKVIQGNVLWLDLMSELAQIFSIGYATIIWDQNKILPQGHLI
jgi:hypothetical protein